jgi:hypothetical protein
MAAVNDDKEPKWLCLGVILLVTAWAVACGVMIRIFKEYVNARG